MCKNEYSASNRKAQLADALVAIYGPVSEVVNETKDVKDRTKLQNIQNKMEKSALRELVSLTSVHLETS